MHEIPTWEPFSDAALADQRQTSLVGTRTTRRFTNS